MPTKAKQNQHLQGVSPHGEPSAEQWFLNFLVSGPSHSEKLL